MTIEQRGQSLFLAERTPYTLFGEIQNAKSPRTLLNPLGLLSVNLSSRASDECAVIRGWNVTCSTVNRSHEVVRSD
jgi:hypothetical protein